MNSANNTDTVWFTTKGRVVIPLRLRKEFKPAKAPAPSSKPPPRAFSLRPVTVARHPTHPWHTQSANPAQKPSKTEIKINWLK